MSSDKRLEALNDWVQGQLGSPTSLEPVSDDASFRRYFRVHTGQDSLIVMDAPPQQEDNEAFVHVARLLREADLNAPEIMEIIHDLCLTVLSARISSIILAINSGPGVVSKLTSSASIWAKKVEIFFKTNP